MKNRLALIAALGYRKVLAIKDGRGETVDVSSVPVGSVRAYTASITGVRDTSGRYPMPGLVTRLNTSVKPTCPHCGSDSIRSKGDKWLCLNPEHFIVALGQPNQFRSKSDHFFN